MKTTTKLSFVALLVASVLLPAVAAAQPQKAPPKKKKKRKPKPGPMYITPDEAKKYSKHVMYFAEHHLKE